ncbi:MBL fold metallo-hydrolase [Sinimarinibacterium sp. NLF-5-8]|uniref:MBL fold metallo-hydrolase n=1 Tax=Sinimarinibacterium sp. NLF-5-8 TaxID=2698684 RepID=UPI001EE439FC|nr:MBL fold metallo-hydrolase [Sinimarinibacterium sp. NLF-5-8]
MKQSKRAGWFVALLMMLGGCGESTLPAVDQPERARADGDIAHWQPLPLAPVPAPEVQALREQLLGADPTDPRAVKLWWVGVSSFIASMGGHLFLLDAWEPIGIQAGYVPITRAQLADLKPEAILIGHGHFDHAADAGEIAARSGAVLVGGDSVCAKARERAQQVENAQNFACVSLGNQNTPGAGSVQQIQLWSDMPPITVIQHLHSAADPGDLLAGGRPLLYVPEVLSYLQHLNTDPRVTLRFLGSLADDGGVGEPQGGTWAYHLRIGDFSLLWHDSAGALGEDNATAQRMRQAFADLPGCVDVQLGALVGFGLLTSGLRDPLAYVDVVRPHVTLPNHHDAWLPLLGGGAAAYEGQWRAALATLVYPPELDYLRDPQDYLRARVYAVDDPRWKIPPPGSRCDPAQNV